MFNPEKTLYRNEKVSPEIERRNREIYENEELFTPEKLKGLFGLGELDLTEEEAQVFRKYVSYVGKRILNAVLTSQDKKFQSIKEVRGELERHMGNFNNLALHDITHSFVAYEKNDGTTNSVVPSFLTTEKGPEHRLRSYKEEVYALLWWNVIGEDPIFTALLNPERLKRWQEAFKTRMKTMDLPEAKETILAIQSVIQNLDSDNFESVLDAHMDIAFSLLKFPVIIEYLETHSRDEGLEKEKREYDAMVEEIKSNKDPHFVKTAKEIFNKYQSDPKILFHKFQEMCSPLLSRLKNLSSLDQ
ncbi:MAG: hypothetical protein V4699_03235 [Patescibacteria group bacterium]